MRIGSKENKYKRGLRCSLMNHKEDIEDEDVDDLGEEEEARSSIITMDNLEIWEEIVNNLHEYIVTIAKLKIMQSKNAHN